MSQVAPIIIDKEKCIKCMECVKTCPTATIYEKDGDIKLTKAADLQCIRCAHCLGVCPKDAIIVTRYTDESEKVPISELKIDSETLLDFLRLRRSTRIFKPDPIEKAEFEKLINAARYAPTGHNDQNCEFTVITGERVNEIRSVILKEFGIIINSLPDDPVKMAKVMENFVPKNMVDTMLTMIEPIKNLVKNADKGSRDFLFWGAPALIIISAKKEFNVNTMIIENASLTASYLMLMAEAMGMGTCSLGLLMFAIYNSRKVRKLVGLPKGNKARYALAVGKKATKFRYLVPRNKPKINFIE